MWKLLPFQSCGATAQCYCFSTSNLSVLLFSSGFTAREGDSFLFQVKKNRCKDNSHPLSFQFVTTSLVKDRIEHVIVFNNGFFLHLASERPLKKITNILMTVVPWRNVALLSFKKEGIDRHDRDEQWVFNLFRKNNVRFLCQLQKSDSITTGAPRRNWVAWFVEYGEASFCSCLYSDQPENAFTCNLKYGL